MTNQKTPVQTIADTLAVVDKTLDNIEPGTTAGDCVWSADEVRDMLRDLRTRLAVETPEQGGLRAQIQELVDNQQSWIDAGRSGQVISRDAMRDTLQRVLDETVPVQGGATEEQIDLDELQHLADAATPGPWERQETVHADNHVTAGGGILTGTHVCGPTYERHNALFIAAARDAVPALIRRVRELEAALSASASAHPADEHHDAEKREAEPEECRHNVMKYTDSVTTKRENFCSHCGYEPVSEDHAATVASDRESDRDRVPLYNSDGTPRSNDEIREHAARISADRDRKKLADRLLGDILDAVPDDNDMQHVLELAAATLAAPVEVDEAKLVEFLESPTHAPAETHSRADGTCTECPWPVYQLPPAEQASKITEWLRGEGR